MQKALGLVRSLAGDCSPSVLPQDVGYQALMVSLNIIARTDDSEQRPDKP